MRIRQATYRIVISSQVLKENLHSIYLRVTHQRRSKYYSLGIYVPIECFTEGRVVGAIKGKQDYNSKIAAIESKCAAVLNGFTLNNTAFSFDLFEASCFPQQKYGKSNNVAAFLLQMQKECQENEKFSKAYLFKAVSDLVPQDLTFERCTAERLESIAALICEKYKGKTAKAYAWALGNALKKARKEGYKVPEITVSVSVDTSTNKKAITLDQLRAISSAEIKTPSEKWSRGIFILSFYLRGMNLSDLYHCQKSQHQNGRIEYRRRKTGRAYNVSVNAPALEIITSMSAKDSPYLIEMGQQTKTRTALQTKHHINHVGNIIKRDIMAIAKRCGIEGNLVFYVARHTFATTLYRNGVDIGIIKEAMGHSDIQVTQVYLKEFGDLAVDSAINNVIF